jgi:flagellin FlaB
MIVFIALILVAAVASAVIIQTAEKLQQTAQQTGDDTASEQGTKIVLLSAIITDTATEEVTLTFELGAGSESIANTAASWNIVCASGAAIATDDDTFANTVNLGAGAAAATLAPGTAYELPVLMANCPLATSTNYNLIMAVSGGGTTYEVLSTGLSIADGQAVI